MASDQASSYFLDINCPAQMALFGTEVGTGSLEEIHAWAASAKAASEKAQDLLADPGAQWPDDVAADVEAFSDVFYPPTIVWLDAVLQEKTLTGAMDVARPSFDNEKGRAAQERLPEKFGTDLGSEASCQGHL